MNYNILYYLILMIILQINFTNAADCTTCTSGQYHDGVAGCLNCDQGYYCAGGCDPKIACAPGTASNAIGADDISTCVTCTIFLSGLLCPQFCYYNM